MTDQVERMLAEARKGRLSRREFMTRTTALGLSSTVAAGMLAGAARADDAGEPQKGGHLTMGLGGGESSNSLDPALTLSQAPYNVIAQIGECLLDVDFDGGLDARVAEEFSSSPDAKVWAFKIRQGVTFHDGNDLTAEDVLATMQRHSDENSNSGALGLMKGIESMRAEGDLFEITLEEPNADLPYLLTDPHLRIQPGGGFDNPGSGIMSGAYRIVSNEPGTRHVMERYENYWDDGRGHFDSTEVLIINDLTARVSALQSGQIDMANLIGPRVAQLLEDAPGVVLERTRGRGQNVFVMMVDTAPFDNNDLRLALKYAIDRQEMLDKVLLGYGTVGNDIPVNSTYPLFDDALPQREHDPEKAAEHYRKSGHDGSPIILRVSDVAFPGAMDAAQLFQQSARKAGIPLELKREPADGYWNEVWNKQPFCASYWTGRATQDQMYATAYLSTADWNDTRFDNGEFDALLMQARAELDADKRTELYNRMSAIVRDEGGLILPMFNDFLDVRSEKIAGWRAHPNADMMNNSAALFCWRA